MSREMHEILKKEGLIKNEPAMRITSEETEHGRLILTSKRLIYARGRTFSSGFIGYLTREHELEIILDIDLDTINSISRESLIVDDNILSIIYLQYETARFSVINYLDWETEIQRARMDPDIPGDPNRQQEAA